MLGGTARACHPAICRCWWRESWHRRRSTPWCSSEHGVADSAFGCYAGLLAAMFFCSLLATCLLQAPCQVLASNLHSVPSPDILTAGCLAPMQTTPTHLPRQQQQQPRCHPMWQLAWQLRCKRCSCTQLSWRAGACYRWQAWRQSTGWWLMAAVGRSMWGMAAACRRTCTWHSRPTVGCPSFRGSSSCSRSGGRGRTTTTSTGQPLQQGRQQRRRATMPSRRLTRVSTAVLFI